VHFSAHAGSGLRFGRTLEEDSPYIVCPGAARQCYEAREECDAINGECVCKTGRTGYLCFDDLDECTLIGADKVCDLDGGICVNRAPGETVMPYYKYTGKIY